MARSRLDLHAILVALLGSQYVFFQPPSTKKMTYPCIVYKRSRMHVLHANNRIYQDKKIYMITVIDPNPDSLIPDKVLNLPLSEFDRHYTANNLNHDVYKINF